MNKTIKSVSFIHVCDVTLLWAITLFTIVVFIWCNYIVLDILLILKWIELATWGTQDEEKQKQKHNTTQHKYVSDTTVLKQA